MKAMEKQQYGLGIMTGIHDKNNGIEGCMRTAYGFLVLLFWLTAFD
jgi:hypothetical protein